MPQHAPRPPFFALSFLALFAAGLAAAALPSVGRAAEQIEAFSVPDRQDGEHFRGTGVGIPPRPVATTFDIDKRDAANFTSFSGGELREEGGSIAFSVAADATETLGWGNVDGTQPADEQWTMPEELAHVTLRIRQAHPAETTVRMHYTRYGDEVGIHEAQDVTATLSGMEWRELRFEQLGFYKSYGAPADGLRFVFDNAADREQRYEIDWIRIEQPRREAYIRRGFVLPDGPILRATAEVSGMDKVRWYRRAVVRQELWINGQKVERLGNLYHLRTGIADIAPYLRPGKNVIGMRGYGVLQPPMLYVEATAMQSGGVTNVMTGEGDWAWSWSADEGWSTVGFDDSGWKPLRARSETTAIEGERDEPSEPYLWRKPDLAFPVYDGSLPLPDWLGLIRLEHGGGADELSFRSDRDAVVHAVVPDLDSFQDPAVEFTLHRTEPDGTNGPAVLAKRVSRTVNGDNSGTLAFPLPLGRLEGGVYTLSTRLIAADGEVLEARPREPILVVSHIEQPEMTGDDPYAALTLDESDSLFIDFTDRSHQQGRDWVETMPGLHGNDPSSEVESWDAAKLKTLNGETYRETFGTTRGSMFSYRFEGDPDGPFQYAPGEYYLFELVYPDDAMRHMEVSVSSKYAGLWNNSQAGVGIDTGDKYPNTGRMQSLRWIHVADPGVHSVDIINAQETRHTTPEPRHAAAQSIRITRIVPPLPAARIGDSRQFGIDSERTAPNSGVGKNFGVERIDDDGGTLTERMVRTLRSSQAAVDRYVQYMRFSGQNTHVIGMWQYHDTNTPYKRTNDAADGRVDPTIRNVLAHTLDANGIGFYAGLEISQLSNLNTAVTDAQVAVGTQNGRSPENDTIMMVDRHGKQFDANASFTYTQNWMHPTVWQGYLDLSGNVARKFDDLAHFRGIHFQLSWAQRSEYYLPGFSWRERSEDPFVYSFDDVTFERFRDDTGIDIAVGSSDPDRFMQRYEAVSSGKHHDAFIKWRNRQLRDFLGAAVERMKSVDEDLEWANLLNIDEVDFYRVWEEWDEEEFDGEGNSFAVLLREYGLDLPLLNAIDDMTVGRSAMGWREMPNSRDTGLSIFGQQNPYHWWARTDERVAEAFDDDSDDLRYVLIRNSWDENVVVGAAGVTRGQRSVGDHGAAFLGGDKGWVMPTRRTRAIPQPRGQHAREPLIQSIILSDPNLLLSAFTDLNINVGHVDALLPLAEVYTRLPYERFDRVLDTGLTTNFAISRLSKDGRTWFYVANPGYWTMPGSVTVRADGDIRDLETDEVVSPAGSGTQEIDLTIEGYNLRAFYVDDPDAEIVSYATGTIDPAEEAGMRDIIAGVAALLPADGPTTDTERFVAAQLNTAQAALDAGEYAEAWALLTHHRFWTWKFRAERPGIPIILDMWKD